MSNQNIPSQNIPSQNIPSDLVVELSIEEQQLLSGRGGGWGFPRRRWGGGWGWRPRRRW